jgi:hypothetical protein
MMLNGDGEWEFGEALKEEITGIFLANQQE